MDRQKKPPAKHMLPWLKRLKQGLEDDDSPDSTPQPAIESRETKTSKEKPHKSKKSSNEEGGRPKKKRRLSSDAGVKNSKVSGEQSLQRLGNAARRKQHHTPLAKLKGVQVETASSTPTEMEKKALRQQRMRKLREHRVASGEHERLAAFKLRRQESKEKSATRAKAMKMSATATREAATGKDRKGSHGVLLAQPTAADRLGRNGGSANMKGKVRSKEAARKKLLVESTKRAPKKLHQRRMNALATAHRDTDDATVAANKPPSTGIPAADSPTKQTPAHDHCITKNAAAMTDEHPGIADATKSETTSAEKVPADSPAKQTSKQLSDERGDVPTTTGGNTDVVAAMESKEASGEQSLGDLQAKSKRENCDGDKGDGPVNTDIEMGVVDDTSNSGGQDSLVAVKEESFVIPKRSFSKPSADRSTIVQPVRNFPPRDQKRVDLPVVAGAGAQVSVGSSPQLSSKEPVRPPRKRTKMAVPVKNSMYSMQDRNLMRLAKKRNSLLVAATQLAAQSPDVQGDKKEAVSNCMADYDVYDVDGKVVPDLISRLSCATKYEMASKRETYGASFFGVSLSAPEAKGTAGPTLDGECGDSESDVGRINCYEGLRFQRPEDRDFYQRRMYGTTFVPQCIRGRTTLIMRNARFERKSTGIRFNQDRDRDEFAAALSKRYTFNKSVPRCDIPRDSWQQLMKSRPASVYLHYNNREDAERATHIFRDDHGNPLELRLEYKAGVVISRSSSPSAAGLYHTPRRSCSSERGAPERSPTSSLTNSARNTPTWRQDRSLDPNSERRRPRFDRLPHVSRRGIEDRYGPRLSGNKRPRSLQGRRSKSRSRSRSKSFNGRRNDSPGRKAAGDEVPIPKVSPLNGAKDREVSDADGTSAAAAANKSDEKKDLQPQNGDGGQEDGEIDTGETTLASVSREDGRKDGGGERQRSPRRWQEQPNDVDSRRWRDERPDNRRDRPRNREYNSFDRDLDRASDRQQSWGRPPSYGGRGDAYDSYGKERRRADNFDPASDSYENNDRGRRMYPDTNRYDERDYRGRGGYNDRRRDQYPRQY